MTRTQSIVCLICALGPMTRRRLREEMYCTDSIVGRALQRLIKWGLVRARNLGDMRYYVMTGDRTMP